MILNKSQMQTLATALRTSTVPVVMDCFGANFRDDTGLLQWCNDNSASDAWPNEITQGELFEAGNMATFGALSQGNREAWKMILDNAPINLARNRLRKAVSEIWLADAAGVLQRCLRKASNGEVILGGTSINEGAVTALKLNTHGMLTLSDISTALDRY